MKIFKNEEGEVRSGWKILILFLVEYILLFIMANVIGSLVVVSRSIRENIYIILMFSQEIVLILTPILSWKVLFKKDLSLIGLKALNKKEVKNLILGLVMGIAAITLAFILIIISKSGVLVNSLLEPRFSLSLVLYLILFIFVGFAEELLSRGYIIGAMEVSNNNKWFAIMVSAVIFSLMHYGNNGFSLIPFLNIFLVGILFGVMYVKTKSIWLSTGFHITWNFFQGCIYGMPVSGITTPKLYEMTFVGNSILNGGTFGPEGGLIVTMVIILMVVSLVFLIKNKKIH
ncbi:CPBP family intramembrane glutamic endopeptidase [Clostridium paraputrificum]|uniref:CPBP family intramembrane glutamic endopeptidase n=1 Tax=Clostridium paraputrificum TaxID=29363 RepID=UPI001B3C6A83|nr:type II CAAX endopeptidase family protein [Clostridium paraputrificum]MDY4722858.1 type II CAAX endopeptidase family protein [Clostridium paraputrificum]